MDTISRIEQDIPTEEVEEEKFYFVEELISKVSYEEYETKISQLLRSGSYNNLRNFLVYYRHLFSTLR